MRILLLALLLAGCGTLLPPTLKPTPPTIDCRKPATSRTPPAPREDRWLQEADGATRLSQEAVNWIIEILGLVDKERSLRAEEHACMDQHDAAGHIVFP